ncbi:TIGR03086 family metal-binding protein [Amycolatopsis albispora]|uniref:TIGR03086 family protein n=1 Tax=Amycolatopsis albispora TaxID=1804986 RepID=A0A344LC71_9PSEU|nr:TIGR03086 family metal-binding protein [Amycolatopsis albispora]AXB45645.1 TIGR03086 family protein [Amycolatopsis albispora]
MPELLPHAADRFTEIVRAIEPGELGAPTPCADYDVRALLRHLLYWGPFLLAGARRSAPPEAAGDETGLVVPDDWAPRLERQAADLVEAFARPGAREGMASFGTSELPAPMLHGMVFGELVVHGWDLARATGRPFSIDPGVAAALYEDIAANAETARQMKVYGPEVPVPASAPMLDRLLGLTGRDPSWTPPAR